MGRIRVVLDRLGPRPQTARRFAPAIETPLRACGARRRVPIGRYLFVKGENPPFHTFPRTRRQRTEFAAICFFRALGSTPPRQSHGWSAGLRPASRGSAKPAPTTPAPATPISRLERRSPTGIARERETRTDDAANLTPRQSHDGAPVSDRHRAGARNPHQRRSAPPISRPGAPVSDRHRAAARNLHRRRLRLAALGAHPGSTTGC